MGPKLHGMQKCVKISAMQNFTHTYEFEHTHHHYHQLHVVCMLPVLQTRKSKDKKVNIFLCGEFESDMYVI